MIPNITFLDLSTMDAGDLDFSQLDPLGNFNSFPSTSPDQVIERLADAQVAIVNKVVLDAEKIAALPELKLIQLSATGTNNIDLPFARERGIDVCNVAGYSSATVAQHTISLLLNLATSVHRFANQAREWSNSPIFTRLDYPATELAGKTLGIVGSGDIGSRVADIAESLGMQVQFFARPGSSNSISPSRPRLAADEFFASSDAITLHAPLTEKNHHLINADSLGQMKPGAFLINTARGDLVDEAALTEALRNGTIAGAGIDVLSIEPPPTDHPLLAVAEEFPGRLIITPHSAWTSTEARQRLLDGMVANIGAWAAGSPQSVVN